MHVIDWHVLCLNYGWCFAVFVDSVETFSHLFSQTALDCDMSSAAFLQIFCQTFFYVEAVNASYICLVAHMERLLPCDAIQA